MHRSFNESPDSSELGKLAKSEPASQTAFMRKNGNVVVMTSMQSHIAAPPVPDNTSMIFPTASVDAPKGHMRTLPESESIEAYIQRRNSGLRKIFQTLEQGPARNTHSFDDGRNLTADEIEFLAAQPTQQKLSIKVDFPLPKEFIRDEYGVKVGNYYDGVRFIRDAIIQCGGMIPLERLETRLGATTELKENIGNVRQFLDIHDGLFSVKKEHENANGLAVFLRDSLDESRMSRAEPGFVLSCPDCGLEIKGLTLPRHHGSRICISLQLMKGCEGESATPIMRLANISMHINRSGFSFDDGDIDDFANALDEAGDVPRFRYSSHQQFAHLVFRAIKAVRNKWTSARNCTNVRDITPFHEDERSYIHFFRALGRNMKRLPFSWIDMGEVYDMCGTVLLDVKDFFPPPPRPADPEIASTNMYPGFLFNDEVLNDEDDINSEIEIEFSDDEASQVEYASMPSIAQLIISAGNSAASREILDILKSHKPAQSIKGSVENSLTRQTSSLAAAQQSEIQEIKQRILSESSIALSRPNDKTAEKSSSNVTYF